MHIVSSAGVSITNVFFLRHILPHDVVFSSTPKDSSELIQINTLVLNVASYGVSEVIIAENQEVSELVTIVDAQTRRVVVKPEDNFFLQVPAPQTIELLGLATVKDSFLGVDAPALTTQFVLALEFVENVSMGRSFFFQDCCTFFLNQSAMKW